MLVLIGRLEGLGIAQGRLVPPGRPQYLPHIWRRRNRGVERSAHEGPLSSRLTFGAQNQIRKAVLATVQFRVVEALDEAWPEIAGPRVLEHVPGYRRSHVERFGLEHLVACRRWQSVLLDEPPLQKLGQDERGQVRMDSQLLADSRGT